MLLRVWPWWFNVGDMGVSLPPAKSDVLKQNNARNAMQEINNASDRDVRIKDPIDILPRGGSRLKAFGINFYIWLPSNFVVSICSSRTLLVWLKFQNIYQTSVTVLGDPFILSKNFVHFGETESENPNLGLTVKGVPRLDILTENDNIRFWDSYIFNVWSELNGRGTFSSY